MVEPSRTEGSISYKAPDDESSRAYTALMLVTPEGAMASRMIFRYLVVNKTLKSDYNNLSGGALNRAAYLLFRSLRRPEKIWAKEEDKKNDKNIDLVMGLSPEEFALFEQKLKDELKAKRRGKNKDLAVPELDEVSKVVYLPSSFLDEDYLIGRFMVVGFKNLGYSVKSFEYPKEIRELSKVAEKYATGICFAHLDRDQDINLSASSSDEIEVGRKYARLQAFMMYVKNYSVETYLKKKQYYFGNNPGETVTINKKPVEVSYIGKDIRTIFKEKDIDTRLLSLLNHILSRVGLSARALRIQLQKELMSYQEIQSKYMSKSVTVRHGKKEITKKSIAGLPNKSPLLLKGEADFIQELIKPAFKLNNPFDGYPSQEDFISTLALDDVTGERSTEMLSINLDLMVKDMQKSLTIRNEVLAKFGQLTTSRLKVIRNALKKESLRKSEVTNDMVAQAVVDYPMTDAKLLGNVKSLRSKDMDLPKLYYYSKHDQNSAYDADILHKFLKSEIRSAHIASIESNKLETYDINRMTSDEKAALEEEKRKKAEQKLLKEAAEEAKKHLDNDVHAGYQKCKRDKDKALYFSNFLASLGRPVSSVKIRILGRLITYPDTLEKCIKVYDEFLKLSEIQRISRKQILNDLDVQSKVDEISILREELKAKSQAFRDVEFRVDKG